jgi:hypothetical protein
MSPRREDAGGRRCVAALECWQNAGPNERRLSAARGPDDGEEGRLLEPGYEVVDELLPAEEELAVLGLERLEALVGAGDVGGRS